MVGLRELDFRREWPNAYETFSVGVTSIVMLAVSGRLGVVLLLTMRPKKSCCSPENTNKRCGLEAGDVFDDAEAWRNHL